MEFNSDNQTLAENKILILYILDKLGRPILHNELLDLVISTSDMNYFYFEQYLLELLEDHYVERQGPEKYETINITDTGKESLKLTIDLLPGINKLKVDSRFKENLDSIQESNSVFAEYKQLTDATYQINCKIVEHSKTVFEIKLIAGSIEQAKKIVDNWNNHAEDIYPKLLDLLT